MSQEILNRIEFSALKSLTDLKISFEPHNVTGIFGVNGCGKSTILHALLCIYKPDNQDPQRDNFRFSQYFTPTNHTKWIGSSFKAIYQHRQDQTEYIDVERTYSKDRSRWKPRYTTRPARSVYYIGVKTCIPEIEIEKVESLIRFVSQNNEDAISSLIKEKASLILNRNYQEYNNLGFRNKKYLGVKNQDKHYSALSMGAGEQRTFKILEVVYKAPKYSLIIIDEIDLTLHTEALNRLISVAIERAKEKNLQIIFTSHREELTKRKDINIRHLHQTATNTLCFNESTPECIARLTGHSTRLIEIFVEDDLAEAIMNRIIENQNIRRYCSIRRFGAIENAFTLATGVYLKGESISNMLIVLDGDRHITIEEKRSQLSRFFSGTETYLQERKEMVVSIISQFVLPIGNSPEEYINNQLKSLGEQNEITSIANTIQGVSNKHEYVNLMIEKLGYEDRNHALNKIVEKLSQTQDWSTYSSLVNNWLIEKKQELRLN